MLINLVSRNNLTMETKGLPKLAWSILKNAQISKELYF